MRRERGLIKGRGNNLAEKAASHVTLPISLSLCRLLRGSKAEAESPIHKGGQGQKGESLAISRVSRDRRRDAKRRPGAPFSRADGDARETERKGEGFVGRRIRGGGSEGAGGKRIFAAH